MKFYILKKRSENRFWTEGEYTLEKTVESYAEVMIYIAENEKKLDIDHGEKFIVTKDRNDVEKLTGKELK